MNSVVGARVDDGAARAAQWVRSQAQNDRAFRSARTHSRMVRLLRVTVPIAVIVVLVGATLVSYFSPARMLKALPVNLDNLVVSGTKITMEKPRLSGFTKDQRAYEFVAEAAAQDLSKPDFVELRQIDAKVQMEDNSTMKMSALTGLYDTKKETLKLEKQILLSSDSGYKGRLTEAMVDVRTGNVVSEQPVELEMLQGVLNAKRLEITNSGEIIRFENGVAMTVMLNGEPLPKEKIPAR